MNCLICGDPTEKTCPRSDLREGVKRRYFPSSKHRNIPMCPTCQLIHRESDSDDGPARSIPGHLFIPGRLDALEGGGAVATADLPMNAEDRLITLWRKASHKMQDAAIAFLEANHNG